ncbi:hypothetical protein FACS1894116_10060 [Betaproteobacteria bacterium]|nr:hypothetical protein FACS1894116_10060 [Betaproteobacteria bacterium]GHU24632.1 hypothetical protein FACS189488_09720 [Betaproteobacteria bacterium]GHU30032.1 hypothetical protein FACS189497_09110 [Betaproteobacteria bacterium]
MIATHPERIRLTGTPIGSHVLLNEFSDEIAPLLREQLLAYGLTTNHALTVLQQQPMTVVLCDHMELALEHGVAQQIWVTEQDQGK